MIDWDLTWVSPDNTLPEGSPIYKLNREFIRICREQSIEACPGPLFEGWLNDAGFEEVTVKKMPLPVGTWPADKHLVSSMFAVAVRAQKQQPARRRILRFPSPFRGPRKGRTIVLG